MHINPTRRKFLALTGAALSFGTATRAEAPAILRKPASTQTIEGRAFGSIWRITLPVHVKAETLRAPIKALLGGVDQQMSPWRTDSEISAFNRAAREIQVSHDTALVATAALTVAKTSSGWFDPTVGPLVSHWGFGPITGESTPRWQGLSVSDQIIAKDDANLTMDLCGIAKGYALDLMAARLKEASLDDFLIDLGGELTARGRHPSGRDWQIAVEDPRQMEEGAVVGLRLMSGMFVATSGLKTQSYDLGTHRYGHIIDPHHAAPVEGLIASVSVIAQNGMLADAWATALTAADADGPALAKQQGLAALFQFRDGAGLRLETTGGFDRQII